MLGSNRANELEKGPEDAKDIDTEGQAELVWPSEWILQPD
jgi:hypothetical protein